MYFMHSFYCEPAERKNLLSTTQHGNNEYCSAITNHENIIATQFHPEKRVQSVYDCWNLGLKNFYSNNYLYYANLIWTSRGSKIL